jgi:acyl-CoA reductase-like NAD-dependent aldehyde dehydrogenase
VNLGPLISAQRRDRVEALVQSAIDEGAEVVCGAKRPDGFVKGFYDEPTVLVGTNEMRIAQKEIFDPVMTVIPYSGVDRDTVRIANDSVYVVVAASTSRAFNVAPPGARWAHERTGRRLLPAPQSKSGIGQTGAFGGFKESGVGREGGRHGFETFTELNSISRS